MSLAMDLTACVICVGDYGTNGCYLAIFSEDVAFALHFVATHPIYRSASGIDCASKILSKMAGNSASYLLNSWWIDRLY